MRRTVVALAVLSVLLGIAGCERDGSILSPSRGAGLESDFAVYRALLGDTTFMPCPVVAMVDSTAIGPGGRTEAYGELIRERLTGLSVDTWNSFQRRNRNRVSIRGFRCPGRSIVFLDARSSWDWERTVPGSCGAVTVSLAGFNRDGTEALVYGSVYWAPLAAYGSLIHLKKKDGEWGVSRSVMIWIS
ncbi:MAG: hypothetical protein QUS35_06495 [bacterium]|nr:hypothetical protein [bacterium]